MGLLKYGPIPASFCLFSFLTNSNFTEKAEGVSRIRTRIVKVESKHADLLTTTRPQQGFFYFIWYSTIFT